MQKVKEDSSAVETEREALRHAEEAAALRLATLSELRESLVSDEALASLVNLWSFSPLAQRRREITSQTLDD